MNSKTRTPPIWLGVLIILIFSLWPFRLINGIFCLGVVLGGMVPAYIHGKQQGNALESSEAILIGLKSGFWASILIIALNALGVYIQFSFPGPTGWLDPIPQYIYLIAVAFWDGLRGLAQGGSLSFKFDINFWERAVITLISNTAFAAFGGIFALTLFKQEPPIETPS